MQVRARKSKARLEMKNLRNLAAYVPLSGLNTEKDIRELSMFINTEPYIKRVLNFTALKKDSRSQVLLKKNLICALCEKTILDFKNLYNLSRFNEKISLRDQVGCSSTKYS
jgi:ribosomal protein S18